MAMAAPRFRECCWRASSLSALQSKSEQSSILLFPSSTVLAMAAERNKRLEHDFEATQHESKKVKGSEEGVVHSRRIRVLKDADEEAECSSGGVVYWVFRDQRCRDNWALIHAAEQARKKGVSFAVVFCLLEQFLGAGARQFGFMLRGMRVMEKNLRKLGIPFFLLQGNPEDILPAFLEKSRASVLVMDFSPLRIVRSWHERIVAELHQTHIAIHEVDAHNVVPVWFASEKLEYGARTIRTKIQKRLPEFLVDYPELGSPVKPWITNPPAIDWDALIAKVLRRCAGVPEVDWIEPGEDAAMEALVGKNGFLTSRIANYSDDRNDPSKPGCISNLSPYLHYGQISAQRCAFEARKVRRIHTRSVDGFLEELIIRRELAENFCYYQRQYDKIQGAWDWAQKTLRDHAADKREHLYTKEQLEKANTDDELWNASQLEMVHRGKMHGFMRMYWAKKILEWTKTPEEALAIAIYLNDKYELDGRDPNGYVGCMWSICGVHDQGWKERPIFGKIRYMNYAGCRRKFNVEKYIAYVNKIVLETQRQNCQPSSKSSVKQTQIELHDTVI